MAVSSYQSIMSSSMSTISSRSRVNQFNNIPSLYMPSIRRNASLKVRSMAEVMFYKTLRLHIFSICYTCLFDLFTTNGQSYVTC